MIQPLRPRIAAGELLIGTVVTLPAPGVAEVLAGAGFDWLFIDTEHAVLDARDAQVLIQAAGDRCACVVRVASGDGVWIKKALDTGASGIIVPQVNSGDDARRVARLGRYPPEGARGVGIGRAQGYGMRVPEYLARANDDVAVIVQVEHIDAVRNIDQIVAVDGIDAVFIGPYDLSASMGRTGEVTHPEVRDAVRSVRDACRAAGRALGVFGVDAAAAAPYVEQGYTLVAVGLDTILLGRAARETLTALRGGE